MAESLETRMKLLEASVELNNKLTGEIHLAVVGPQDKPGLKGRVGVLEVKMRYVLALAIPAAIFLIKRAFSS